MVSSTSPTCAIASAIAQQLPVRCSLAPETLLSWAKIPWKEEDKIGKMVSFGIKPSQAQFSQVFFLSLLSLHFLVCANSLSCTCARLGRHNDRSFRCVYARYHVLVSYDAIICFCSERTPVYGDICQGDAQAREASVLPGSKSQDSPSLLRERSIPPYFCTMCDSPSGAHSCNVLLTLGRVPLKFEGPCDDRWMALILVRMLCLQACPTLALVRRKCADSIPRSDRPHLRSWKR